MPIRVTPHLLASVGPAIAFDGVYGSRGDAVRQGLVPCIGVPFAIVVRCGQTKAESDDARQHR